MLVRLQFGNSSHTTALLPGTVVVVLLARALLLLLLALRLPEVLYQGRGVFGGNIEN